MGYKIGKYTKKGKTTVNRTTAFHNATMRDIEMER
jgi:hypothetical protein